MPNQVSFTTPFSAEAESIARQRRLAEALQAQSMQPLETNQTAGGYVVPVSPFQGLAKMLQAYSGRKGIDAANEAEKGLAGRRNQALADALSSMPQARTQDMNPVAVDDEGNTLPQALKTSQPTMQDNATFMSRLAQIDPSAVQIGGTLLNMQQKAQENQATREATAADKAATREFMSADRAAAREQRAQELQLRLADARTTAQDRMAMQRELAQLADQTRRELAQQSIANQRAIADQSNQTRMDVARIAQAGKTEKPMNEFQGKSMLYGTRAAQSDKILRGLEDNISLTGLAAKQSAQNIPIIGGVLGAVGNAALSSEQQRVEQAQRDFVNAVLRQESGAVIADTEFKNAQRQYFPQPGDSKEVIAQKRQNRQTAINGFERMAGPGGNDIKALRGSELMPSQPKASAAVPGGVDPAVWAVMTPEEKALWK